MRKESRGKNKRKESRQKNQEAVKTQLQTLNNKNLYSYNLAS
jgi:hypothetical protein